MGSLRRLWPSPLGSVSAPQGRGRGGNLANGKAEVSSQGQGCVLPVSGLRKIGVAR